MDFLEQPDVKKTYEKCKYIVKVWEHKFTKKHKRLPSKLDIREASSEVRHAYRKYFQLKTAALEQSFIDVEGFEDEEDGSDKNKESTQTVSNVVKDQNESLSNEKSIPENFAIAQNIRPPTEIWGVHLNKNDETRKPDLTSEGTNKKPNLNLSITKKLFCGSKFTKRNPRKSLSFSQKTKSDINVDNQISLSQPISTARPFSTFKSEDAIILSQEDSIFKNDKFQIVSTADNKVISQPVNIIQSFMENSYHHSLKTVDTGWLERVAKKTSTTIDNPNLPLPSSQYSTNTFTNTSQFTTPVLEVKNIETTKVDYDSEDIIDDSDEDIPYTELSTLHIVKKRKIEHVPNDVNSVNKLSNSTTSMSNHVIPIPGTPSQDEVLNGDQIIAHETVTDQCRNTNFESMITNEADDVYDFRENYVAEKNTEPRINAKRKSRKKSHLKASKLIKKSEPKPRGSEENKTLVIGTDEISPRRSSRQTRPKFSLQEFSSEEEDAFHTDTDEKDPEFSLESAQTKAPKQIFGIEIAEATGVLSKNKPGKPKSILVSPTRNSRKICKKKDKRELEDDEADENKPYELEFCVKPRIVAPRYSSIRKVLKEKTIVTKGDNTAKTLKNEIDSREDTSFIKDKRQQAKENLEKKIASGNLNENFVRINIKKKVFARGKSGKSFSKYKKAQWKSNKAKAICGPEMDMGGCDGGMLTCFNCGQVGHFARNCKAEKGDGLLPLNSNQEEACPYPTLEEASAMARESVLSVRKSKLCIQETENLKKGQFEKTIDDTEFNRSEEKEDKEVHDKIEDDFDDEFDSEDLLIETLKLEEHVKKLDVRLYMDTVRVVKPYFELNEDGSTIATPLEVYETLKQFGHSSFRPGQEQAIMRILSGKSTLVTLSTGSGKSLCYQLPAYLYSQREPCISLIISPLVSLMDDQVVGIPKFMKAACLHSNQTKTQRRKILEAISMGELSILLVSPEAVVAGEKQTGFDSLLRKLPPIAFACIDEAHCVSQWSHNFRPSYLMICRVLRESLGVKNILGLTATATRATKDSIVKHLQIPDGPRGIISDIPLPDNLLLTVSKDPMRDHALLGLLLSERFSNCKSIIIYCTRRDECERIACFLRTSLKSEQVVENIIKKRKRLNLQAEPYHAGLSSSRRRTIQNRFMSGELRIVVATVAFGMGINKSDIRAVIHFNMPNSFESYVQEVGRAGRDGLRAHCHVFLDSQGRDENELRRHVHANSIDRHVIRKLLQKIFIPCSCTVHCPKHEVAFSIENTVRALDIPEENISTLLCYLELHENKYIQLLNPAYTLCKVISYGGPLQIRKAAKECPPLAMALALHKTNVGDDPNVLEFPVVDVASAMGWESGICKHKLKNLEWITVNNQQERSTISIQFSDLGFRLLAPGNLSDDELDEALDSLYNRVTDQEQKALLQLHAVHKTLLEVAQPSYRTCISENGDNLIKSKIREYFNSPDPLKLTPEIEPKKFNEEQLVSDIHALICMYRDNTFTGRSVARIFQGIQSPNYPAVIWGRCKFWRSHVDTDFQTIVKIATREIIRMR